LSVVDTLHQQSKKFITGVENKVTGDSNVNASPGEERRDWGTIAESFHDFHGNTTSIVVLYSCGDYISVNT